MHLMTANMHPYIIAIISQRDTQKVKYYINVKKRLVSVSFQFNLFTCICSKNSMVFFQYQGA